MKNIEKKRKKERTYPATDCSTPSERCQRRADEPLAIDLAEMVEDTVLLR